MVFVNVNETVWISAKQDEIMQNETKLDEI
jgi:hypothetical protein